MVTAAVQTHIENLPRGEPFTTASLLVHGTRAAVDQALSRLARAGVIQRVARGVYVRPEVSRYVGTVPPEPLKIAQAVAHGETVQVHGAEAARRLGLTTQVPTRPVFLTSGASRRFHLGELEVALQHVSPRKLALAGRPAGLALTALWYLGKEHVTTEVLRTVEERLPPEEFSALRAATYAMPAWMVDAFHAYEGGDALG